VLGPGKLERRKYLEKVLGAESIVTCGAGIGLELGVTRSGRNRPMKLDISSEFEPGRARLTRESGGRVSKESLVTGVTHNVIFRKYIHIFGIGENGIQKGGT
jgi:hypothetical protein